MGEEPKGVRVRRLDLGVAVAILGLTVAGVFKAGQIDGRLSVMETLIGDPTNIPQVREMRQLLDSVVAAGATEDRDVGPVAIGYPTDGDTVNATLAVRGIADTARIQAPLRVVVWSQVTSRFYPQEVDAVREVDGDWSAQTAIGGPRSRGEHFDILVVELTSEHAAAFGSYLALWGGRPDSPGLAALPEGSRIWDRVSVVRGGFSPFP